MVFKPPGVLQPREPKISHVESVSGCWWTMGPLLRVSHEDVRVSLRAHVGGGQTAAAANKGGV